MKRVSITILFSMAFLYMLVGCKNDKDEILNPPSTCDTTDVRYSSTVVQILESNCYRCHTPSTNAGGPNFGTYAELAALASNGSLLGAVNHESGFTPMPLNAGKLSACDLAKLRIWVDAGFPNN